MDISPDKQNIDRVFANIIYHIDFYQREYRWNDEPVLRLLEDVFYKFNENYEKYADLPPSQQVIDEKYPWYYLNTYVTNKVGGKTFVVDGQQRLTTLTLILMKLLHLAQHFGSKAEKWLDSKICGQVGFETQFWMNHEAHKATQQAIYENNLEIVDSSTGITAQNMVKNYQTISKYLDKNIDSKHKLETFVFYFLNRLVLINLSVEQTDVPMIFEAINDRGIRLKPFEILKGKLLGQIDKTLLDQKDYNGLWEKRIRAINEYSENEADRFFRFYLKSKFASTRSEGQKYDGDYHRIMFTEVVDQYLRLNHNQAGVIEFLEKSFAYYSQLYLKALKAYNYDDQSNFLYNRVNDLDGGYLLVLSSCSINDPEEALKFEIIPKEIDRLFSLLQLQDAYDSNSFQEVLYKISNQIRGVKVDAIRGIFDEALISELSSSRNALVEKTFNYNFFKNIGIGLNKRFIRYFFARIERFLAQGMKLNMKHSIYDLTIRTGSVNGFHIEHILSHNAENLALFENNQERFETERNRLGGLLLLKGRDNISSNNEVYSKKLKTYANTLYWNETLREDTYKSKLDLENFRAKYGLDLQPIDMFDADSIEKRQQLLYKMASAIWE